MTLIVLKNNHHIQLCRSPNQNNAIDWFPIFFSIFLLYKKSHVTHLTPYFERRSLDKGAAISFLLMCDGAVKWRLRCFLEEDETFLFNFILDLGMDLKSKNLSQFCMSCSAI